jgi:REP-associated tyrosine transposase
VISAARREQLQKYITGIVTHKGQKLIAIHCMPDHTHILLGLKPGIAPSDLIGDIKTGSSNHINKQRWFGCRFSWQEGFGAFSFRILISIGSSSTFKIRRCIIGKNHSNRNTLDF